ncbi:hypothetical protein PS880_05756 [Pseudomonas fluorescens]|uniref:HTH cro/C1-type domain-containing protein n=2 Tax=Pseudomonas fluorescens TaxID=294 RepID=A0A5E7Q6C6_PSEFL|nr:hypothetical protein PS880_05756 [Pseudomonas fluorescens]
MPYSPKLSRSTSWQSLKEHGIMTLLAPFLDASSPAIVPSKRSYGDATPAISGYAPQVYNLSPTVKKSKAAARHTKFSAFVERLERDPLHAKGLAENRVLVADALYPEDGTTLKTLRLKAGLTQTQLAAALETSQPHVARMEMGRQEPVMSTCRKLGAVFGVSLDVISSALERQAEINESKVGK